MAKVKDNHTTIVPLIGSGVLGAGAYGSYRLNKALEDIGISSKMRINPEALRAFDDYTKLTANPLSPDTFGYQYAQAANRAGNVQLFLNDPKKRSAWEWEINNPRIRKRLGSKLEWLINKIDRSPSFIKNMLGSNVEHVKALLGGAKDSLAPLDEYVARILRENPGKSVKHVINSLAHVPAMAQSPLDSYVRLLGEIAPDVSVRDFADNTLEALMNYKNPTYKDFLGRTFESPGDYMNELHTPAGHKKTKGAFDAYLKSIQESDKGRQFFRRTKPSKKQIDLFRHDIAGLLTPNTTRYSIGPNGKRIMIPGKMDAELYKTVGSRSVWDAVRNKNGGIDGIKMIRPTRLVPGITSIQDIRDLTYKNIGLKALDALATARYSEAAQPYAKLTNAVRIGQFLRSGKLRAGLALSSLGLGGLSILNMIRNKRARDKNKSIFSGII